MSNPLGSLPASNSQRFTLNSIDWLKILRYLLIQAIGGFIGIAPTLMGERYVIFGQDVTQYVILLIPVLVEAGRRFMAGGQSGAGTN